MKKEKSLLIFQGFVTCTATGAVDVRQLFSKQCYEYWLQSRANMPKNPPEAFRKALTSHCSGVDGRRPFEPRIEEALLIELRKKQVWECFKGTKSKVGQRGLQVKGYWEKQNGEDYETDNQDSNKRRRSASSRTKNKKRKKFTPIKQENSETVVKTNYTNFVASATELLFPLETYSPVSLLDMYRAVDPFEELLSDLQ